MIKIITLLLLMVAGSYGQWITKTTAPETIGTATTANLTATLNTLSGVVTTDVASGNAEPIIQINNSYLTASSVVLYSVQFLDASDFAGNKIMMHGISEVAAGHFTIHFVREAAFAGEIRIHFTIIN